MAIHIIIPSRLNSARLPKKALADINGAPLVVRVYQQASKANNIASVVIATDHQEIISACNDHNVKAVLTSDKHPSGTERLCEVVSNNKDLYKDDDVIINVQGDEPLIPIENIEQVAQNLQSQIDAKRYNPEVVVATLCTKINELDEILDPNAVKVVFDQNKLALYFSRAPIPYARDFFPNNLPKNLSENKSYQAYRHIGLYAYKCKFLRDYAKLCEGCDKNYDIASWESLEQLKVMSLGYRIHVDINAKISPAGVDTEADLERVINNY